MRSFYRPMTLTQLSPVLLVLFVLVSMPLAAPVQAQDMVVEDVPAVVIAGFGITGGFPTGEFGDNVTNPGIGISGYAGYMIPRTPAVIGLGPGTT